MKKLFKEIKHPSFTETIQGAFLVFCVSLAGSAILVGIEQGVYAIIRLFIK